jgi:hypothetical protein
MIKTAGWILAASLVVGSVGLAAAQVPTPGSQQKRPVGTPGVSTTGKAAPGTPTRTNPSANPFADPLMQPIPPASSTINPQQNYQRPIGPR